MCSTENIFPFQNSRDKKDFLQQESVPVDQLTQPECGNGGSEGTSIHETESITQQPCPNKNWWYPSD
jgi:hypothetical protein